MLDLQPEYRAMVKSLLREHFPDCEVRAYGSRVRGNAAKYSDLDISIVGDGKLDRWKLMDLRYAFDESDLPIRVDVHDWHNTSSDFQRIIEENYVVIQYPQHEKTAR